MSVSRERLDDLLVQRATEGLDSIQVAELDRLLGEHPQVDPHSFDRAAAALHLACLRGRTPPVELRSKLEAAARRFAQDRRQPSRVVRPAFGRGVRRPPRSAPWPWVAVAAAVLVAAAAWWPRLRQVSAPAADRAALLAHGAEELRWMATEDPAAASASGDVVWDPAMQRGFVRFVGLAANDPSHAEYQLWIFDATRDQRYPVDGGVFDIPPASREVIVPIRASLPVGRAVMFAVTVERPGGVVVSNRDRIVLLAQAG